MGALERRAAVKNYGLIGYPLSHSFSAELFNGFFAQHGIHACYRNYPLRRADLIGELVESEKLCGFNVTYPYKNDIIPYLDAIDPLADKLAAVNCVKVSDGKLTGYNTDVAGAAHSIAELVGDSPVRALILGSGGSARSVAHALREAGRGFEMVSRSASLLPGAIAYSDLSPAVMDGHRLIVNCTPVGMYPLQNECPPIPYQLITPAHFVLDLIYNPAETQFLRRAAAAGAAVMNGLPMLREQAAQSWLLFGS